MSHIFFLPGFCFLLVHEMDAIRAKEWKIFPGLSKMGDDAGYITFAALHIPIYALLLWGLYDGGNVNFALIAGLDVFFVFHVFLHIGLYNHPENRFRSIFSYVLIVGAGIFGATDLLLS